MLKEQEDALRYASAIERQFFKVLQTPGHVPNCQKNHPVPKCQKMSTKISETPVMSTYQNIYENFRIFKI